MLDYQSTSHTFFSIIKQSPTLHPSSLKYTTNHKKPSMKEGHQLLLFYPNATSNIIMTVNPTKAPKVAMSVFDPPVSRCASGINSSTTT